MPELPEVESVARSLAPRLVGRTVREVEASGLPLRRPIELRKLRAACRGARFLAVRRVGKYLLLDLSSTSTVLVHLGMSGQLVFAAPDEPRRPHTHAVFALDGLELRYVDPRRFGVVQVYAAEALASSPELSVLGLDPLVPEFTPTHLYQLLREARRDLKGFLLDQSRIAGIGNIYACEALFLSGLSPRRRTERVSAERAERLHRAIRQVLESSIANGGTSFSDYVDADGQLGSNQDALYVYGREGQPCRACAAPIRRLVQGARSTFFCRRCQK